MTIPRFLYVPRINTLGEDKIILETRKFIFWLVKEFESNLHLNEWHEANEANLKEEYTTITIHRKYPICLLCLGAKTDIDTEQIVKIGNRAVDWYVQFYLDEKNT